MDIQRKIGGPTVYVMSQLKNTGTYIILFNYKRRTDGIKDEHSFVYFSDYKDPSGVQHFYGAILDNRENAPLRALQSCDINTFHACRRTVDEFFGVEVRITHAYNIKPRSIIKIGRNK